MNIEELFDNEKWAGYGIVVTDDANQAIDYLKTEVMEYVAGLQKRIAELETAKDNYKQMVVEQKQRIAELELRLGCCRDASTGKDLLIAELEFDKANMVDRIIGLEIHKTGVIGQANRIAELEEQNLNMMALFRDFYDLEFNRDECWEIIKKYGGDA